MVLGDAFSNLETFVWILNHISRSITWSMLTLKASNLVNWPISTWSFMWCCQIIDWLKFETRPRSLMNFGTAYLARAHGFQKTNMPSIERSFYLLKTRTICVTFPYNWTQCIDGVSLLLPRYVRKGNDAKNPVIFSFCLLLKEPS